MTAEIAIVNRQTIALAADSAVTIGKDRVWKTANKLFSLGPKHDIGIMMYGSADYLGHSWEVVIKEFRNVAASRHYATVKECADDFNAFIQGDKFSHALNEKICLWILFKDQLDRLKKNLKYSKKAEFRAKLIEKTASFRGVYINSAALINDARITLTRFRELWADSIKDLAKDIFGEVITAPIMAQLTNLLYEVSTRRVPSGYQSGIVIAGFGQDEMFPHMHHYVVDGRCGDINRTWLERCNNLSSPDSTPAYIAPFAQSDIIYILMEGISKQHINFVSRVLSTVITEKSKSLVGNYISNEEERRVELARQAVEDKSIIESFESEFEKYRAATLVKPILDVVMTLPKEEMAAMAEAMVEITSLRRRIDSPTESVGGPVDVAVISKGDGFIWLKRKHYFTLDLNQDFLYRKRIREGDD